LHPRSSAGDEIMPTDQELRETATRYAVYSISVMGLALLAAFLFLFNFTNFFKLAVPL
jgi:hypothetical protein